MEKDFKTVYKVYVVSINFIARVICWRYWLSFVYSIFSSNVDLITHLWVINFYIWRLNFVEVCTNSDMEVKSFHLLILKLLEFCKFFSFIEIFLIPAFNELHFSFSFIELLIWCLPIVQLHVNYHASGINGQRWIL